MLNEMYYFKEDKSASSSFSFSFENSIFAAIGIIGLDENPLNSPHFVSVSR